ncbi:hypothetical protein ABZ949_01935 [Micromonospora tulbaghiae]|uniref:hypothetical protein n=1 Tax=Micromonospora tulbaghiae TaxID=479978 RepID=UPI0033F5B8F6
MTDTAHAHPAREALTRWLFNLMAPRGEDTARAWEETSEANRNSYRSIADSLIEVVERESRPADSGRCGDRLTTTIANADTPAEVCALPHGHPGWHRSDSGAEWSPDPDAGLPLLLAAVDNALRNGSYMTNANVAFNMLCDRLGVDRDRLVFDPGWAAKLRQETSQ